MGNSLCASAREDANGSVKGFAWFRQEPEVKSRPVFRETEAVKKAQEEREEREAREERERTLETAIEGGLKGIATALSHTTDPEVIDKLLVALEKEDTASAAMVKGELAKTVVDAIFRVAEIGEPERFRPMALRRIASMAQQQALSPLLIKLGCHRRVLEMVSAKRTHAPTVFWGFSALYYLLRPDGATPSRERVNALRGVGGLSLCDAMLECHPDDTEIRASVQEIRRVLLR